MNIETGEIRYWDDLTAEEKASGKWIQLPPVSDAGRPEARRRTVLDDLRIPVRDLKGEADRHFEREMKREHREASQFPNRGRSG